MGTKDTFYFQRDNDLKNNIFPNKNQLTKNKIPSKTRHKHKRNAHYFIQNGNIFFFCSLDFYPVKIVRIFFLFVKRYFSTLNNMLVRDYNLYSFSFSF